MANNPVYFGSDIKLKITVDFGADVDMDTTDFYVVLSCGMKQLKLQKSQLVKVDSKTYLACVKSPDTGRGRVNVKLCAALPDTDFPDNVHTVVHRFDTDVEIL